MRTLVVGDVHGCLDLLRKLLDELRFSPGDDHLIFVGDLIDRGPDPAGVVQLARSLNAESVLGNHEEKMLRWFKREAERTATGKPNKMQPPHPDRLRQWNDLSDDDRAWLAHLPLTIDVGDWTVVHGGFEAPADVFSKLGPVAIVDPGVVRVRWLDSVTGKHVGLKRDDMGRPEGVVWWTERFACPRNVVYGHAVHSLEEPRVDGSLAGYVCVGIDTGACFGGRLTALCLETRDTWQVSDGIAHAEWHGPASA